MQSSAYSLSHTLPTPNPLKLSHPCPSLHRYNPLSKALTYTLSTSSSPQPRHNALITLPKLTPEPLFKGVQVKAAADSISQSADHDDDDEVSTSKFKDTLVLGLLFGLWNIFNIYFNIYNKQVLTFILIYHYAFVIVCLLVFCLFEIYEGQWMKIL